MRPRFAVLGVVIASVAIAVAPGIAAAAPRHNHGLTINATPNPIIAGEGVLSISELDAFARRGGMIQLTKKANRFRFAVNIDAVARNGLRISSKLLQLAEVIHQSDERRRKP